MSCRHLIYLEGKPKHLVRSRLRYLAGELGCSLTEAAKAGHEKCPETLIKAGADVNITDFFGNTAISESAFYDYVECFKLLLNAGADVNMNNSSDGSCIFFIIL